MICILLVLNSHIICVFHVPVLKPASFDKSLHAFKAGLYRIWLGVHRLGDIGVYTLGDTSAFVNLAGQLLLITIINSGPIAEWMASAWYLNSI